jgi:mannose-1-phosphate guanylyltransferase/mannose-6-phosphate isomerase
MAEANIELEALILEPVGRSTAPAIALAAHHMIKKDPEAVILCCPADHVIANPSVFVDVVTMALPAAQKGALVIFGIEPGKPDTGFGYIRQGKSLDSTNKLFEVDGFVEKPDLQAAKNMLEIGGHLWNAGIFLMRADAYLDELKRLQPKIYEATRIAMRDAGPDLDIIRPAIDAFAACPSLSIDYAVMEHTDKALVAPARLQWSDIGSWDALYENGSADKDGVVSIGDVIMQQVKNTYIRSESRLVACVGVSDLAIVETADAVLVAHRDQAQNVKQIYEKLAAKNRREAMHHTHVDRPWGSFETLALGPRFQVKRIIVKPGGILSLQKHHHRAEHWIVVEGTANVTIGEEVRLISENQSTYIPLGEVHRLENPGKFPLVLIEVQTGSYLGEDDIIRLEDVYKRVGTD